MYILGISCYYHDSSAALIKDGKVIAAAEEERFTRVKHDNSFPKESITFCLESEKITIDDIDYIGFYEKPLMKLERILFSQIEMFPLGLRTFVNAMPSWIHDKTRIISKIRKELKYKKDIIFIRHHLAHAGSAFLVSPFKHSAILTIDGVGEWETTTIGTGKGKDIRIMESIEFPHSIGLLYSSITAYLGFSVNNSEYKVMGLSPYGNMDREKNKYYMLLKKTIDIKEDGSFFLDMSYFKYHFSDRMPSGKLCRLLEGPIRKKDEAITKRHKDIAAALQMITEDVIFKILRHLRKITKEDNVVISGGVGLNSVANGKILKETGFKRIWIQPASSDSGTSIGVASYIYHSILRKERKKETVLDNACLGPVYPDEKIKEFLDENDIIYESFNTRREKIDRTARLILDNKVVGWFQGRMEFGPRALGARSILANPCNPRAKELLNEKVKHRESFRPFAPAVCIDDAARYFECDEPIPVPVDFMLMVYPIRKRFHKIIPSVTHVDGSGRIQTVRREQNEDYFDLIKRFGRLSGVPILINTSFNIRGEPIVCTPNDAYKCMMGTGIDYLVIGKFIISRNENKKDIWDSEKNAKD